MTREVEQDLQEYCERSLRLGPHGLSSKCITGATFITFGTRQKAEGAMGTDYTTLAEAKLVFKQAFDEYQAAIPRGKGSTLYWRQTPLVEVHKERFSIFARLVIDQAEAEIGIDYVKEAK